VIASLKGKVLVKSPTGAIIDVSGVGYGVSMSLSSLAKVGDEGAEARLFVHTHVSQDAIRLYGFADREEQAFFEILVATTGVGPKLALSILSAMSPSDLSLAVAAGDKVALTRIPGIGNKTAERLLVELKHRLPDARATTSKPTAPHGIMPDLVSALVNLGFKLAVSEEVARTTLGEYPNETDLAALVRHALRASTR
jgi:holliday junction DNA helicase RuvA